MLFVLSLSLRALFAHEMAGTPLYRQTEWRETDNRFFTDWAHRIAGGDWLGREPNHPFHSWHAAVAKRWAKAQGVAYTEVGAKRIWNHWYGGARFHQEPLYAYALATVEILTGDVRWTFALQAFLGALTTVLLFAIGHRLGGTPVGILAAVLHLAYGPFLYYDFMLHRTSLQTFGGVLTVLLVMRARQSGRLSDYAALGAALGGTTLLVSTAGPTLLVVAGVTLVTGRAVGVRRALVMAGVAALFVAPAVARNLAVGVAPFELSSVGAITFIDANASDVNPSAGFTSSAHSHELMAASDGHFGAAALTTIRGHDGAGWFLLLARKLLYFFTPMEIPNNDSYAYYASYSWWLGGPLIGFHLFASLLPLGLWAGLRRRQTAWPVLLQVGLGLAVTIAFYNLSRFRAPVLASSLPLAGLAVIDLVGAIRSRSVARLLVTAVIGAAPWVGLSLVKPVSAKPIRSVDLSTGGYMWRNAIKAEPDPARALAIAERALTDGPKVEVFLADDSPWDVGGRIRVARRTAEIERDAAGLARKCFLSPSGHEQRAAELEALATRLESPAPKGLAPP